MILQNIAISCKIYCDLSSLKSLNFYNHQKYRNDYCVGILNVIDEIN